MGSSQDPRFAPLDTAERFTFESGSEKGPLPLAQHDGLALLFGTSTPKFPADHALGRFRLGMAIEEVYLGAAHGAFQVMSGDGNGDQKCALKSVKASASVFVYVPAFIHIEASDGAYQLGFERIGDLMVVSSIDWHPAKKAMSAKLSDYYTPIELRDKLIPLLGRPSFQLAGRDLQNAGPQDATVRWCTARDKTCSIEDGARDTDYAAISIVPAGVPDASVVLLDGTLDQHGKRRASSQNLSRTGGDTRPGCVMTTYAEAKLFSGYTAATNEDGVDYDKQVILRRTFLPSSIQSQITNADGELDYAKTQDGKFVLFLTVYVPDSEINIRENVIVFAPTSSGLYRIAYRGGWLGLKTHIRDRKIFL